MAATNKTPNYKLNQWLPADILSWDDVNSDNLKIDAALGNCWNKAGLRIESGNANMLRFSDNPSIGYVTREARYWIQGNMCTVQFVFRTDGTSLPPNPISLYLTGLPVTPAVGVTLVSNHLWMVGLNPDKTTLPAQVSSIIQQGDTFKFTAFNGSSGWYQAMTSDWLATEGSNSIIAGQITYKI